MYKVLTKIKQKILTPRKNKNLLENTILFDTDSVICTDNIGTIIYLNHTAKEKFPLLNLNSPIQIGLRTPLFYEAFDNLKNASDNRMSLEISVHNPSEQNFDVIMIKSDNAYYFRLHDITEQKKSHTMHRDFIANLSHEMRTPLASILGFIETLQGPAKDDADAREQFLNVMYAQAKRMKSLVDGLLSLSRHELNKHIYPTNTIELSEIIADVTITSQPLAKPKNIQITNKSDATPRHTIGNRDEIFQVLQNLVENAIKYSNNDTEVTLDILSTDENWVLSISDNGRGIEQQHLSRLTERFYRVDDARNRKEGGAGLGLSIVASILSRHKAKLDIESEVGKGSVFKVIMPKI